MNNTTCHPYNTLNQFPVNNTIVCSCHRGYYGDTCEQQYEWYAPILLTVFILEGICMLSFLVWTMFRLAYIISKKTFTFNLATVSIMFNAVACALRLAYVSLPSRSVHQAIEAENITFAQIVLVHTAISLWMTTTLLVKGFWYDLFRKMQNRDITARTTAIVSSMSGLVLVGTIAGMIMIVIIPGANVIGLLIILVVLISAVIMMVVYTHKVRIGSKDITGTNKHKISWTVKTFISLDVLWSLYVFANILTSVLSSSGSAPLNIIPDIMFRLCECGIVFCIMLLLDYNFNSIKYVFRCGHANTISTISTGIKSSV